MTAIALIPARGGSQRVLKKNIKPLNGIPLIAYTIAAAIQSGCFEKVLVSSDDTATLEIAARHGADCIRRPDPYATSTSPDIEWVKHALGSTKTSYFSMFPDKEGAAHVARVGVPYHTFSILRPTSPFRLPSTIKRAFGRWYDCNAVNGDLPRHIQVPYSSLRAVSPVSQHPGKTWRIVGDQLVPLLLQPTGVPFHDSQLASLPPVYVQNASLEIAWTSTVETTGTISGDRVMAFLSEDNEAFDINNERDWMVAEQMVLDGVELPHVS